MDPEAFFSILDYVVDGPDTQRELVDAFAELQERWVRSHPGYRSATIFASVGGDRVVNLVQWASEADFRRFEEVSDTEGRTRAIDAALAALSGHAEPQMSGPPRFRVARVVGPGPRPAEGTTADR